MVEAKGSYEFKSVNHGSELLFNLNEMRYQSIFTDFVINIKETSIPCHKAVLVSMVPYFKSLVSRFAL